MNNNTNKDCCGCYDEKINHIKCEVSNCVYHGRGDSCNAQCIEVTPSYADRSVDTACSTFKAEQQ